MISLFKINTVSCTVLERINRFSVRVLLDGKELYAHLNNTGKLSQWLQKGNIGFCYRINGKKLSYRLLAIKYKQLSVLIDTYVHMKAFEELIKKNIILRGCKIVKKNPKVNNSVFDYLLDCGIVEVKSATLKNGDFAEYPDTFTTRGERHIKLLKELSDNKYNTFLVFVSGIPDVSKFKINEKYGWEIRRLLLNSKIKILAFNITYDPQDSYIKYIKNLEVVI